MSSTTHRWPAALLTTPLRPSTGPSMFPSYHRLIEFRLKKNAAAVENFAFTDAIPVIPTVLTGPYPKGGQDGQAMTVSQGLLSPNL